MLFCQAGVSIYIVSGSPFYVSFPADKVPDLVTLLEETFSPSHMPSSSSVTDQVWFPSPSPLPFVSQVYVLVCSCIWLSPFLTALCGVKKKVLNQILLKEQTLSFHIPLQSKSKLFSFDIQPAPWHPLQDNGVAQRPGFFPKAETLSMPAGLRYCKPTGQDCKSVLWSNWQLPYSVPSLRLVSDLPALHIEI